MTDDEERREKKFPSPFDRMNRFARVEDVGVFKRCRRVMGRRS
jgi:hypothetical protein